MMQNWMQVLAGESPPNAFVDRAGGCSIPRAAGKCFERSLSDLAGVAPRPDASHRIEQGDLSDAARSRR